MLGKKDFTFDKRLTDRFIKRGSLSRAEYQRHLDSLVDVSDKAAPLNPDGHQPPDLTDEDDGLEDDEGDA